MFHNKIEAPPRDTPEESTKCANIKKWTKLIVQFYLHY